MNRSLSRHIYKHPASKNAKHVALFFCALVALLLFSAACVPAAKDLVYASPPSDSTHLSSEITVGQTFVAEHAGLNEFGVWAKVTTAPEGDIIMHLREEPTANDDIVTIVRHLDQLSKSGYINFKFPVQSESNSRYYYVFLEVTAPSTVIAIETDSSAAYDEGALYLNNLPQETVLSFHLAYALVPQVINLISEVIKATRWVLYSCLLFIIPGWAILTLLPGIHDFSWGEVLGSSIGFSFALYPLLLIWTYAIGAKLGAGLAWIPVLLGCTKLGIHYHIWNTREVINSIRKHLKTAINLVDIVYIFVIFLLVISRLSPVRLVEIPFWGDSVQHSTIVQLIFDNKGLFESWLPYTPYKTLTMHFGFHALSAVFGWAAGLTAPQSTLVAGQLINVMSILALYPLSLRLSHGNRWAGVATVIAAGIFSPMPSYYVNWGRYPQLAGLAILPVAIWIIISVLDSDSVSLSAILCSAFTLAGMLLTYYRMPYFYAVFMLFWICAWTIKHYQSPGHRWVRIFISFGQVAIVTIILCVPWIWRLQDAKLTSVIGDAAGKSSVFDNVWLDYQVWRDITLYVPLYMLLIFAGGLVWGVLKKEWSIITVGLWVFGLAGLVATRLFGLPGANLVNNFSVVISLYMPVSLVVGWFGATIINLVTADQNKVKYALVVCICILLTFWGTIMQSDVLDTTYQMVNRPDTRAMAWIHENVPADAIFLVQGFRNATGRIAAGSDAGWWLPVLTKRQNTMPPQYALINEQPIDPSYTQSVLDLVADLEVNPPSSSVALQALCKNKVSHVYIGQKQGEVGFGIRALFRANDFLTSDMFSPVYHQDRVWIFELEPEACQVN